MIQYQLLKSSWKWFSNKYLIETILWIIFTIALIASAIVWESNNTIFSKILLMDFFNNAFITDDVIATLKTYLYIAILASCIAAGALILIQVKFWIKKYIETKYEVISSFENNFFIFKTSLLLNVAKNITYIFCFTNAFTAALVLIYWFLYFTVHSILEKIIGNKNQILSNVWWKDSQKRSLFLILGIEALYLIVKNLILKFTNGQTNIDQVLKYFIPASSLALILAVFIQSLVKNDVKSVLSNINNVITKVDNFKIFYNWDLQRVLGDYLFVKEAPLIIRKKIKSKVLSNNEKEEVLVLLTEIYKFLNFVETQNIKISELRYIYYHLFYELDDASEMEQIKNRIIKTKKSTNIIKG